MNFFAHAVVSGWLTPDVATGSTSPALSAVTATPGDAPAIALGAMLPDLAGMCGARIGAVHDEAIARGVQLHHETDAAFHSLPGFAMLCAGAARGLRERGVSRGPARGAAHVAVELFLDGALATDASGARHEPRHRAYVRALAAGAPDARGARIEWSPAEREPAWQALRNHLAARGAPVDNRDPDTVAARVIRALARRPRLAVASEETAALHAELRVLAPRVEAAAPALMRALRAALASPRTGETASH